MYQEDLYPSTVSSQPALSAEEWFSGRDENPIMMDLKTGIQIDENENVRIFLLLSNFICILIIKYRNNLKNVCF